MKGHGFFASDEACSYLIIKGSYMTIKSLFVAIAIFATSFNILPVSASALNEEEPRPATTISRAPSWGTMLITGVLFGAAIIDVAAGSPVATSVTNCATSIDMAEIAQAGLFHMIGTYYKKTGGFSSNLAHLGYQIFEEFGSFDALYDNAYYYQIPLDKYHLILLSTLSNSTHTVCQYILGVVSPTNCWLVPDDVLNVVRQ